MSDRVNCLTKVHINTKRTSLPLENHSSKHSKERGGRKGGWEGRREEGEAREEEVEGKGGRV